MTLNTLIFSDKRSVWIKRHLLFWSCWFLHFCMTHAANPFGSPEISYFKKPAFTILESILLILTQVPIVYIMVYIVLPVFFLKKRYLLGALATNLLWFLAGMIAFFLFNNVFPGILSLFLSPEALTGTQRPTSQSFFMSVVFMNKGAFAVTSSALVIKFAKYWYLKEQRNLQLQKQNTEAQLQLLTAQVHPHFLFNTLNNIYSQAQNESPKSSKMIMGLSDLLRYILYEGKKPLVSLEQELGMMLEYINLEKIRYGNKLDLHYQVTDKTKNIYIAPLLLLPFIENCFKHGASNILQNPWINLTIEVEDTTLIMKLINGKSANTEMVSKKQGIGIVNVRQRLELLYKDKHDLQIREEEDVFIVDLKIELIKIKDPQTINTQTTSQIIYA